MLVAVSSMVIPKLARRSADTVTRTEVSTPEDIGGLAISALKDFRCKVQLVALTLE